LREVFIRASSTRDDMQIRDRLVALIATGLQRLLEKERGSSAVDYRADESVTTTCPHTGAGEDGLN
jgi:hypothetical protein